MIWLWIVSDMKLEIYHWISIIRTYSCFIEMQLFRKRSESIWFARNRFAFVKRNIIVIFADRMHFLIAFKYELAEHFLSLIGMFSLYMILNYFELSHFKQLNFCWRDVILRFEVVKRLVMHCILSLLTGKCLSEGQGRGNKQIRDILDLRVLISFISSNLDLIDL